MDNSKKKIFAESDFDKELPNKKKSNKNWRVIGVVVAIISIALCVCLWLFKDGSNNESGPTIEQGPIKDSINNEPSSTTSDNETKGVEEQRGKPTDTPDNTVEQPNSTQKKSSSEQKEDATSTVEFNNRRSSVDVVDGTLEEKAKQVIRGNYGNGIERKQKLGDQYAEIQGKVNEMYKNDLVD